MFQKKNDKLESFIGCGSEVIGDLTVSGTLRIDGKLTGNATAGWIIVGEKAVVKGDLAAKGIVVGGRIEGSVKADDLVELKPSARLYGDIFSKKLAIAEGGVFMGRSVTQCADAGLVNFSGEEASAQ
ncbi:MAG TPA: polymer-forming cytoskeletal protein [Dissulfurispiraceae bacterium]|nr:polymer-forming cytoskeletal protein [Dissulfurispiraceae bacterium]